jgi:hypothetical protein
MIEMAGNFAISSFSWLELGKYVALFHTLSSWADGHGKI